jgi:uncharacterized membrane protein YbaN (DUF454 family)
MPTTVFILIASYCFARSSPRLERWLLEHPRFGPGLRRFREQRGMPRSAKIAALGAMWTAITMSSLVLAMTAPKAVWAVVGLGVCGTGAILFWVRTVAEDNRAEKRSV